MKKNVFKRLWEYLRVYRLSVILAIALKLLGAVMNVLEPFVFGLVITELTNNLMAMANGVAHATLNYVYIGWLLILYVVRGTLYSLSAYGSNYYMTSAVQRTVQDIRHALSEKINRIPVSYFDRHQFGDMLGRFTSDVETVSNALQQSVMQIINALFSVVLVFVMVLYLNAGLGMIIIISTPIMYIVSQKIVSLSQPYFKRQANILGDLNGFVQENLSGFNVIKLYGQEENSTKRFYRITEELQEVGFKSSFLSGLMMPLVGFISHLSYLLITLLGGLQVLAGTLTIGNLQALVQYVWQMSQPVQTFTQIAPILQSAKAALERIFEVLDEVEEASVQEKESVYNHVELTGRVTFENVSFQYTPDKPLIRQFHLDVEPGEMVAIVGPTGAGKTTLINLLMRFYEVDSGTIKVGGIPIQDIDRQVYRQQFGMVLQDAWLYEGTIRENLRFGNLQATDEEIVAAAKAANVDHFIRTLPGGYNMKMNQESSNISLGQKQLLTIARALLSNPTILILDEATSSVDTRLEQMIQKAMKTLMQGRTSFVIAHRLSTIQEADKILVLRDGQIVEQGNHTSLLEAKGFYYELYQSQFSE